MPKKKVKQHLETIINLPSLTSIGTLNITSKVTSNVTIKIEVLKDVGKCVSVSVYKNGIFQREISLCIGGIAEISHDLIIDIGS